MSAIGPGDLVKCVNNDAKPGLVWHDDRPVCGKIYTVTAVIDCPLPYADGARTLVLAEATNRIPGYGECGFDPDRFVPVRDDAISLAVVA